MTIKLGETAEKALAMHIAEGLAGVTFERDYLDGRSLNWCSAKAAGLSAEAENILDRYCGGFREFIYSELYADIRLNNLEIKQNSSLTDYSIFKNTPLYAKNLVLKIKSLPLRYRLTVALPTELSDPIIEEIPSPTHVSNDILIACGNDLPQNLPLKSNSPSRDFRLFRDFIDKEHPEPGFFSDRLYFSMPLLGYANYARSTRVGREFEDYLKAFYGAGMALGLFEREWTFDSGDRHRLPFITIHTVGDNPEIIETEKLDKDLLDADWYVSTGSFAPKNKEDLWAAFQIASQAIASVFRSSRESRRLFTACIWYYRATVNKRPLDRLLESTIAIEVLLGDKQTAEGLGLTNLLKNRCAFLLGDTIERRNNILSAFGKIYALRSNIVHEGRHKLAPGEESTVDAAVKLCGEIIAKEMTVRADA